MPEAGPLCTALPEKPSWPVCQAPLLPSGSSSQVSWGYFAPTCMTETCAPLNLLSCCSHLASRTWRAGPVPRASFAFPCGFPFPGRPLLCCQSLEEPLLNVTSAGTGTFSLKQRESPPPLLCHLYSFGLFSHHTALFVCMSDPPL